MDLHSARKIADWDATPAAKRNYWQQLAARTHGLATPGNIATILGLALVVIGLVAIERGDFVVGLVTVMFGRIADVLDGLIAARTRTKSRLGEALDAGADKIAIAGTLVVVVLQHVLPLWLALLAATKSAANVVFAAIAQSQKRPLHPSAAGKLATGGEWLALGLLIGAKAAEGRHMHALGTDLGAAGVVLLIATLACNYGVSFGYARKVVERHG